MIIIDGSQGEGGGQILRTSLTLSCLTGKAITIKNIRSGRSKPGLLRQHLTCVLAAAKITNAKVEGADLKSEHICFTPSKINGGQYQFNIGTAGSTTLVCQTVLPILIFADQPSTLLFEGGTHNGMSPSLDFLEIAYLPILKRMGLEYSLKKDRIGFYPAGGGRWQLTLSPNHALQPFTLNNDFSTFSFNGMVSQLSESILERELKQAHKTLNHPIDSKVLRKVDAQCSGNIMHLAAQSSSHTCVVELNGKIGVKAESVAKRVCNIMNKLVESKTEVDEFLADQLLIPMLFAQGSQFSTHIISKHTETNMNVINQFLKESIQMDEKAENNFTVKSLINFNL